MFRKSRSASSELRLTVAFAVLFVLAAAFPSLTLSSGQVIKQFETYSLAQSMAAVGWNPFATTIPCDGGIRWVLELPIFAGLGGIFVKIAPEWPSILPVLVFGFFLFGLLRIRERLAPDSNILAWITVAATPVFLRFSTQFLSDPFTVALLLFGTGYFLEKRRALAALFFLFAVSVKPTVLPSILFFRWAFAEDRDPRKLFPPGAVKWLAREAMMAVFFVAPFAAWSLAVKWLGIPSPMHEGGIMAIGADWGILTEYAFYSKFFNWTAFKGVGIPLFAFALYGGYRARKSAPTLESDRILRLAAWSVGIFPYWLLVRRLNVIHDYYSLSFFLPIAILGALAVPVGRITRVILLASIAQGVGLMIASGMSLPRNVPVADRPVFCGKEFRSENLMGIPPADAPPEN